LPKASAEAWQAAAPNSVVENLYGPTELTIACFLHQWDPATSPALCHNEIVPIGRPYPGLEAVLLDEQLKPVAPGEPGELCVSGPQTTPGYWNAPERTAERYVTLAVSPFESRRFYRTGDRVQQLPAGDYVYIGRTDQQIKVLGHRVELGEIEAVLRADGTVGQVAALGWPVEQTGAANGVVAFVSGKEIDTKRLKAQASQQLPAYMVPQEIFVLDQMPLNANGKIDRLVLRKQYLEKV
jgi:acyl-coenzyme A synthetase/AMP-(fatty) acid ligase